MSDNKSCFSTQISKRSDVFAQNAKKARSRRLSPYPRIPDGLTNVDRLARKSHNRASANWTPPRHAPTRRFLFSIIAPRRPGFLPDLLPSFFPPPFFSSFWNSFFRLNTCKHVHSYEIIIFRLACGNYGKRWIFFIRHQFRKIIIQSENRD